MMKLRTMKNKARPLSVDRLGYDGIIDSSYHYKVGFRGFLNFWKEAQFPNRYKLFTRKQYLLNDDCN